MMAEGERWESARGKDLAVGSEERESAHLWVIQQPLKRAGAWGDANKP